ncbi:unnamed protein product [Albugo candida]|uniref:Uncharacterized protein n=1 Tax=Albugo candida TaxID=65357 RepID=A0A024GLF2_9STRA|nr:unnamed protein product [Albugo candida]|eukprot:CCI47550.1 unnamed protein product [Albugo candida]
MGELRALVLPRARSRTDSIENYIGKPQGDFIVSFHRVRKYPSNSKKPPFYLSTPLHKLILLSIVFKHLYRRQLRRYFCTDAADSAIRYIPITSRVRFLHNISLPMPTPLQKTRILHICIHQLAQKPCVIDKVARQPTISLSSRNLYS